MRGGETDAQSRGASCNGWRADGGHVKTQGGKLSGCLERAFLVAENDGMDGGGWRRIKQGSKRAQVLAALVAFRADAEIECGGRRCGVGGGCGGGKNEAAGSVDEKVDKRT